MIDLPVGKHDVPFSKAVNNHRRSIRKKFSGRILAALLCLTMVSPCVWADRLTLKSGKVVEGKIVERTDQAIQLDVGLDFPITYYTDEIKDIAQSPAGASDKSSSPSSPARLSAADDSTESKADQVEQQGLDLIDQGQVDQGVKLLHEAIGLDPQANRHLNLGAILIGNGVALQKQGKSDEALKDFQEAESELQQAIKTFDPNGETTFISEAYNLLGEMYANALHDKIKAKTYFEKSLSFYDNPAAKRGIESLQ